LPLSPQYFVFRRSAVKVTNDQVRLVLQRMMVDLQTVTTFPGKWFSLCLQLFQQQLC